MGAPRKNSTASENKILQLAGAKKQREVKPASNPELREQQLVSSAVDLAERQLRDGTASSAVIVHYLKIASKREFLEREILERQSSLLEAKASSISKGSDTANEAKAALEALKTYKSGSE